jgi:uncharacterized membrane protein
MVNLKRLGRHVLHGNRALRRRFPPPVLASIESAVGRSETIHGGEIRFVVEASLPWDAVWTGLTPRQRAMDVFAQCGVWDTEENNGVLIYVLLADRDVEIVADRGLNKKIVPAQWEDVCRVMETHYRQGHFEKGSLAGLEMVTQLLARHFPPGAHNPNELPNKPTLL